MKSEAMFPNHNDIELPFVIHAIGTAQRQYRRKRDEGCCFAQVIYGETGEGRLSVEGKTYDIHPEPVSFCRGTCRTTIGR